MRDKDTITVYWAPASFTYGLESWSMLYREPDLLFSEISRPGSLGDMKRCPAAKDFMKNTFVFRSNIADSFKLPPSEWLDENAFLREESVPLPVDSKISILKRRASSIPGHINVEYNLKWIMFSDEPLEANFTPPYFPSVSPVKDSYLAIGEYDIGQWFRPINLDYHIPVTATDFSIKENDPLFFVKFNTTKKIVFKQFKYTQELNEMSKEFQFSPSMYGLNKTLRSRYLVAKRSKMPEMVLAEIRKNLI